MTPMEDELIGRQTQCKTTSMEDGNYGRGPLWKRTTMEDNLNGRQPQLCTELVPAQPQLVLLLLSSQICSMMLELIFHDWLLYNVSMPPVAKMWKLSVHCTYCPGICFYQLILDTRHLFKLHSSRRLRIRRKTNLYRINILYFTMDGYLNPLRLRTDQLTSKIIRYSASKEALS